VVASGLALVHADEVVQAIEAPIEVGLDRSGALSALLAPPTRPVMLRPA
jgi:hypothetical protein